VFVFEAHEAGWLVDALIDNPHQWTVDNAFDARAHSSKENRESPGGCSTGSKPQA
jgi:hypothetical protein